MVYSGNGVTVSSCIHFPTKDTLETLLCIPVACSLSSVVGHPSEFCSSAVMYSAAVNMDVHVCLWLADIRALGTYRGRT